MQNLAELLVSKINQADLDSCQHLMSTATKLNIDLINAKVADTPILHTAIQTNNPEIVRWVLDQPDLQLEATDHLGQTAIHHAAALNTPDIVLLLIEQNANVHVVTNEQKTALMIAAFTGCAANCEILLNQNINANKRCRDNSALDKALLRLKNATRHTPEYDESIAVLKVLLHNGLAFCQDLPMELTQHAEVMNHFKNCYFFETTLSGEKLSANTSGFELATAFEHSKLDDTLPYTQLKFRCVEILLENPQAKSVRNLLKCFMHSEKKPDGEDGEFALKLTDLCIQQIARQPNLTLEQLETQIPIELSKPVADIRRLRFEEFEMCTARIEHLQRHHKRQFLISVFKAAAQLVISEGILIPATVFADIKYNELCPYSEEKKARPANCGLPGGAGITLLILLAIFSALLCAWLILKATLYSTIPPADRQRFSDESEEIPTPEDGENTLVYIDTLQEYRQSLNERPTSQNNPFFFFQEVCQKKRGEVRIEIMDDEADDESDLESEASDTVPLLRTSRPREG